MREMGKKEKKRGKEKKKKEVPSGEVIKEGASWLAWQQFKGVDPPCRPAPKWQLLAPLLNTQCLVAKLCLSLTDEWGKARKREREEGRQNAAILFVFFPLLKKKTNLREV